MARYTEAHLMKLSKRKLVKLLEKEGIDASGSQKKSELVRLLILAHKANAPTRVSRFNGPNISPRTKVGLFIILVIILVVVLLFRLSTTFKENVNYVFSGIFGSEEEPEAESGDGPIVYEKGGKTYVVYNHPRPEVTVITDKACKRPECDLSSYYDEIKSGVTNLALFTEIDYRTRAAERMVKELDVNLLPVLVFDSTIEKTDNFEKSSRFLKKVDDKYLLSLDPYKAIESPDLSNAQILGNDLTLDETPLTVIEFTSFSCPHCVDAFDTPERLLEIYDGNIRVAIKYYSRGGNDFQAAVAAECAAQQDAFLPMHNLLFERQSDWLPTNESRLSSVFSGYAAELGLTTSEFSECYNDDQLVKDLVNAHTAEAEAFGIDGLPTFFVNNNILEGAYPIDNLSELIDEILREDGFKIETNEIESDETTEESA
jgi:protein-disulfide isomerase